MHSVRWGTFFGNLKLGNFLFAGIASAVGSCAGRCSLEVSPVFLGFVASGAKGSDELVWVDLSRTHNWLC